MTHGKESAETWYDLLQRIAHLLGGWRDLPDPRSMRVASQQPHCVPVVRHLSGAMDLTVPATAGACTRLAELQDGLCWRQNANYTDVTFLDRYGYCELLGPNGHWHTDAVAVGVLLLGPDTFYPEHAHPAREHYVVLGGTAEWWQHGGGWRRLPPGSLIEHASGQPHAMRTARQPLLAAYLWHDHLQHGAKLTSHRREASDE